MCSCVFAKHNSNKYKCKKIFNQLNNIILELHISLASSHSPHDSKSGEDQKHCDCNGCNQSKKWIAVIVDIVALGTYKGI